MHVYFEARPSSSCRFRKKKNKDRMKKKIKNKVRRGARHIQIKSKRSRRHRKAKRFHFERARTHERASNFLYVQGVPFENRVAYTSRKETQRSAHRRHHETSDLLSSARSLVCKQVSKKTKKNKKNGNGTG